MSDFKDVAHKTVAELFDMLKEKVAEIEKLKSENDELQKRVDCLQENLMDLKEDITLQEYLYQGDPYNQGWNSALSMIEQKLEKLIGGDQKALRGEHE
jgi:predicted nuclease with TOPRIM domain